MNKAITLLIALGILSAAVTTNAAETKVNGRLYMGWQLNTSDNANDENEFSLGRAYVTVTSKLSDRTSARITTDIRETDAFDGYTIILKYGYIDMKPDFGHGNLMVRFGLQPTPYIDQMNKLWGRRYMIKTVGDLNKVLTTSDLGAGATFALGEKGKVGSLNVIIFNGSSYSHVAEENKQKDINAFLQLNPFMNYENLKRSSFQAQAYFGTQNKEIALDEEASAYKNQIVSVGGLLGYQKSVDVGFDVNFVTSGNGYDSVGTEIVEVGEVKSSAISVFGTLYLSGIADEGSILRTVNLFGRYDMVDPNTDADDDASKLIVFGVECVPTKSIQASVNFRSASYDEVTKENDNSVNFNTLFKF